MVPTTELLVGSSCETVPSPLFATQICGPRTPAMAQGELPTTAVATTVSEDGEITATELAVFSAT